MNLLKCGIPPQDLLASAIINHLPDVTAWELEHPKDDVDKI